MSEDAQLKLAKLSGVIEAHPGLNLAIEGYTDTTGTPDYNLKLSQQRADAVRDFLIAQGMSPDTITAKGLGQADPVADNSTATGRETESPRGNHRLRRSDWRQNGQVSAALHEREGDSVVCETVPACFELVLPSVAKNPCSNPSETATSFRMQSLRTEESLWASERRVRRFDFRSCFFRWPRRSPMARLSKFVGNRCRHHQRCVSPQYLQ